MEKIVNLVVYFSLTALIFFQYETDVRMGAWPIAAVLCGFIWALWIADKLGFWAAALCFYALLSGLWMFSWVHGDVDKYSIPTLFSLYRHSTHSTLLMVLFVSAVAALKLERLRGLLTYLGVINFFNCLYVIYQFATRLDYFISGGFLWNASINASFIAVFWSVLQHRLRPGWPRWVNLGVTWLAVLCSGSSIGLLAFLLSLVFYYRKWGHYVFILWATLCGGMYYFIESSLLSSSGRFKVWSDLLTWHWKEFNLIFGSGNGTFQVWSVNIQKTLGTFDENNTWLWMHNDWAQIYFDLGILGTVLAMGFYISTVRGAPKYLMPSLIAFIPVSFFNWPLHEPRFAVASAILFAASIKKARLMRPLPDLHGHLNGKIGKVASAIFLKFFGNIK